jgi:hypothetical protein
MFLVPAAHLSACGKQSVDHQAIRLPLTRFTKEKIMVVYVTGAGLPC